MLAEPEAAAVEEAAVEAAVEEEAVEAEEPPQAVRTPAAPTTAEAFRKSRRDHFHNFVLLHYACHSISQIALFARFAVSVCIITICGTVRNRTNHQDSWSYFVRVPQDLLLYPKIFFVKQHNSSCLCNLRPKIVCLCVISCKMVTGSSVSSAQRCNNFIGLRQISILSGFPGNFHSFWKSIFLH